MPVVPFAPTALSNPRAALPDEPWALMAAAQMHSEGRLVQPEPKIEAGRGGGNSGGGSGTPTYAFPQHFENAASEWARGNMSSKEFRELVRKEGWSIDPYEMQRSRKSTIDVFDPSGKMHELTP